ncbi:shikimate dehydrogenase [Diaminobutyricibacter tongyongensis]|uniref:Shikimate dehydrogenase n=1 Tax=Leifsonia tongyongensis TaxID=1268043 RepID=A0A6L9XYE2_9MICO|nr:shikimate dehydrogenase [Diaminobutyricibacter tongyongensis]NEN06306.1 shikimate dehydrogenase [Diaminobutyricibacter tongyongensis]
MDSKRAKPADTTPATEAEADPSETVEALVEADVETELDEFEEVEVLDDAVDSAQSAADESAPDDGAEPAELEELDEAAELEEAVELEEAEAAAPRRLAVLGSPIAHSKSPALHAAAYAALGLDWSYEAVEVAEDALPAFIDACARDAEWRGLSLTMPLKQAVIPLLNDTDRVASVTGAANTVLFDDSEAAVAELAPHDAETESDGEHDGASVVIRGFNTDVAGIVRALAAAGLTSARYVLILGGGATAASAMVAAAELGAEKVVVAARSLERSVWLEPLAHSLGLMIAIRSLGQADRTLDVPDLVVSTLPAGAGADVLFTDSTRRRATLLDVSYDPWPSTFARAWAGVGGTVVSGLAMLTHQALLQVRIFVSGDPLQPLDDEDAVLAAMLAAVGIDATGRLIDEEADEPVDE